MALLEAFVGGTYQALSPTMAADLAVNVFAETRRVDGSKKTRWLLGTPGLKLFATGGALQCRGWFSQDGRTFVVLGANLYEVTIATATLTLLGTITNNDGDPASFASNGQGGDQIAIVGGDELKILDTSTNTLSAAITLPFSGPVMVVFLDAYFLINQRDSPIIWFSALDDGTSWDGLDFIARSGTSDNIIGIGVAQNRLWAFGSKSTGLFYDAGDVDTPFLPYPGTITQIGAVTPWAIVRRSDVFTWLAQDGTGTPRIVKAAGGPAPTTISTPPIEQWLAACASLATAEMLTYQQAGHTFVAITCPDSPDDVQTYVWDDTEQLWHARAGWDQAKGRFTRWAARGCAHVEGLVFVGDAETGDLYTLDLDTYTDNGAMVVRDRTIPYVSDENQWLFLDQVELAAQVGVGLLTGQGSQPVVELSISRDAARTWISAGTAILGAMGAYASRTIWRRLGRVRMDRLVLKVRQTDPVRCAWLGLHLRSTAGTGQL